MVVVFGASATACGTTLGATLTSFKRRHGSHVIQTLAEKEQQPANERQVHRTCDNAKWLNMQVMPSYNNIITARVHFEIGCWTNTSAQWLCTHAQREEQELAGLTGRARGTGAVLRLRGNERREDLGEHDEHALEQFTRLAAGKRALPERHQQQEHSTTTAHAAVHSLVTHPVNQCIPRK